MIETHCHLDYLKSSPVPEIIQQAKNLGVEKLITISVEPDNFSIASDLAKQYDNVYCTQGVHPHQANLYTPEVDQDLNHRFPELPKAVAVGEIGLDYHYLKSPKETQRQAFEKQIAIALKHNLPVVIHSRDADDDTIEILSRYRGSLRGVIHSFTAGKELAEFAIDNNFCLGFNGIITFKKADNVREIVSLAPLEHILLETDSPFLAPVPHRGKENTPCLLPLVAEAVANIKSLDIEEVIEQTNTNAQELFQFQ